MMTYLIMIAWNAVIMKIMMKTCIQYFHTKSGGAKCKAMVCSATQYRGKSVELFSGGKVWNFLFLAKYETFKKSCFLHGN